MHLRIIFLSLFALVIGQSQAQSDTLKPNSIFFAAGGISGYYSINYEHRIKFRCNTGLSLGVGFAPVLGRFNFFSPRLPLQLKFYYILRKHMIELGGATCPYAYFEKDLTFIENITGVQFAHFVQLAYKYSFSRQRFSVGAAFTPLIMDHGNTQFYPWGALRFGVNF
jgi:hypothetical protein